MDFFTTLQFLGWLAVGLVMYLFAATGGFDFGAGMLVPFVGKTDAERRVIINTVGPTWDGNQVWLITAGGAIFAIWPRVYAASFSGFYFGFLLVLWSLFLRPVSFEYRSKLQSASWRGFWDWMLAIGSFLPPLIIGVAVGNLFLGVPFQVDPMSLRFVYGDTLANTSAFMALLGLLRPFALLVGIVCVLMMLMHGSAYLNMRTRGTVYQRTRKVLKVSAWLFIVTFVLAGCWLAFGITGYQLNHAVIATSLIHPLTNQVSHSVGGWMHNYHQHFWLWGAPLLAVLGALMAIIWTAQEKVVKAFTASCVSVLGVLGTMGFTLFPFIMVSSTHPAQSLTAWDATSSQLSLIGILVCAVIMLPIIFYYTAFVYKKLWGRDVKMSVETINDNQYLLY